MVAIALFPAEAARLSFVLLRKELLQGKPFSPATSRSWPFSSHSFIHLFIYSLIHSFRLLGLQSDFLSSSGLLLSLCLSEFFQNWFQFPFSLLSLLLLVTNVCWAPAVSSCVSIRLYLCPGKSQAWVRQARGKWLTATYACTEDAWSLTSRHFWNWNASLSSYTCWERERERRNLPISESESTTSSYPWMLLICTSALHLHASREHAEGATLGGTPPKCRAWAKG